ncbi:MAG: glycosyltransferase family 2 protein [Actinomycetota bacterium]
MDREASPPGKPPSTGEGSPLFSVIVSAYGRPQYLSQALGSVASQTIGDFECIVVDDASPEPLAAPADARFRIIRRETNGGPAAARNTGVGAARGTYVTFLDDDDVYTPRKLELGLRGMSRAPIAVCWSASLDGGRPSGRTLEGDVSDSILEGIVPHVGTTTVRRDLILSFDESLRAGDDIEWWLRLAQVAPVTTVPEVGYLFRYHQAPRHGRAAAVRLAGGLDVLRRHADYFADHPKAAAFRWFRIGQHVGRVGDNRLARRAFLRSFRSRPSARTAWYALRSLRPSRASLERREPPPGAEGGSGR